MGPIPSSVVTMCGVTCPSPSRPKLFWLSKPPVAETSLISPGLGSLALQVLPPTSPAVLAVVASAAMI